MATTETPIQLTDVQGLSDRYGWSVHTIRSWRQRGIGPPAYKINGKVLFDLAEVDTWVRAQRDQGA